MCGDYGVVGEEDYVKWMNFWNFNVIFWYLFWGKIFLKEEIILVVICEVFYIFISLLGDFIS